MAKQLLCMGFLKVTRQQQEMHKKLRGMLPRRESERRAHPLARKSDILDAIETRISLLNMTYNKYIDSAMCCFIPGKVSSSSYALYCISLFVPCNLNKLLLCRKLQYIVYDLTVGV